MVTALRKAYPRRLEVPVFIFLSGILLWVALQLPLVEVEKRVLWKHWKNGYSIYQGVKSLWEQNEYLLAAVLFFFSMVFPIGKLVALAVIWFVPMRETDRKKVVHWLGLLGKWSMLDVFVVAILIVLVKLGSLVQVHPLAGVYVFSIAILSSMLTTMYVRYLTRKA